MNDDDRDSAAALAEAARAREERRREADRNEVFNDVYKTVDEIRAEWRDQVKKQWYWFAGFAAAVLAGLAVHVFWVLAMIAAIGMIMTWERARERKRSYERVLFENELERKILAHEAGK